MLKDQIRYELHSWFNSGGIVPWDQSVTAWFDAALEFHIMEETIEQLRAEIAELKRQATKRVCWDDPD